MSKLNKKFLLLNFLIITMIVISSCSTEKKIENANEKSFTSIEEEQSRTESKKVKSDWVHDGEDTYYVNAKGDVVKNEWLILNDNYYYFGDDGKLVKSQWINDEYYVNEKGIMLRDTMTPDGKEVGPDGRVLEFADGYNVETQADVYENTVYTTKELKDLYDKSKQFISKAINTDGSFWIITSEQKSNDIIINVQVYRKDKTKDVWSKTLSAGNYEDVVYKKNSKEIDEMEFNNSYFFAANMKDYYESAKVEEK